MILWFSIGVIAWISCVSFMLAIIKGGHRVRGSGYEQKLQLQSMVNTQNRRKAGEEKTKNGREVAGRRITERRVKGRRITQRRSMERRITDGSTTDRNLTEGVLIIKRLKQRRLGQRRCGQRRNMESFGWQENPSMN